MTSTNAVITELIKVLFLLLPFISHPLGLDRLSPSPSLSINNQIGLVNPGRANGFPVAGINGIDVVVGTYFREMEMKEEYSAWILLSSSLNNETNLTAKVYLSAYR